VFSGVETRPSEMPKDSTAVGHDLDVAAGTPNEQNALQGDFGESWLRAVAAGCGLLLDSDGL